MKWFHQQGLHSEHLDKFSAAERQQVITCLQEMPEFQFKHSMRCLVILRSTCGGQVSEHLAVKRG